jgi:phospholipid/cholesterol/gamma-HCH transport system permease protein
MPDREKPAKQERKEHKEAFRLLHPPMITPAVIYSGEFALKLLADVVSMLAMIGEIASGLFQALRNPHKVRWRETLYYMDVCGADAVPIVMMICFLMGLILGFQGSLQMHKFGTDIFVADLVGLSIVKELGPLMVAMICTGRAGSAFAAELGTMKVGEEIDAMVTMGFVPSRFLIVPKVIALFAVMPVLTVFGDVMGIFGGLVVGNLNLDIRVVAYYNRTVFAVHPQFFFEGLVKSMVFALLIASVGCFRGLQASNDTQGVGRAATSAVVTGIFLVVVADTALTYIFSKLW